METLTTTQRKIPHRYMYIDDLFLALLTFFFSLKQRNNPGASFEEWKIHDICAFQRYGSGR